MFQKKIDGLDVDMIFSLQSLESRTFKTITIPKSVVEISEGACVGLEIEKVIWEKDSKIKNIGNNALLSEIIFAGIPLKDMINDSCIWKISYHDNKDFENNKKFTKRIGVKNYAQISFSDKE